MIKLIFGLKNGFENLEFQIHNGPQLGCLTLIQKTFGDIHLIMKVYRGRNNVFKTEGAIQTHP